MNLLLFIVISFKNFQSLRYTHSCLYFNLQVINSTKDFKLFVLDFFLILLANILSYFLANDLHRCFAPKSLLINFTI